MPLGSGVPGGAGVHLGVGIAGMRERVQQLGGELEIASGPGGTTVRATLPLPSEAA
jgi:signal transduction histidine kinase